MTCKSAFFGILGLFLVSIIAVIYLTFGWQSVSFMNDTDLKDKYISKDGLVFYDLPADIQNKYISKDSVPAPKVEEKIITKIDDTKVNELTAENEKLRAKLEEMSQVVVQTKSTPEPKKVEEDTKENFALYKNTPIITLRCSDFKDNQYFLTQNCQAKIDDFLATYDKPAHFEIISMIDEADFHNFKSTNKDEMINTLIDEGLAKLRAKEVGWYIRQNSKSGSVYSFPPYQFKTEMTRGVVINIY